MILGKQMFTFLIAAVKSSKNTLTHACLLFALLVISGCSLFNQSAEDSRQPATLQAINNSLTVKTVWKTSIGDGAQGLSFNLRPNVQDDVLYLASSNGSVRALNASTGANIWTVNTGVILSAGPSASSQQVIVAGNNGDVIALEAKTGTELWRTKVSGEVIAAPGVGIEQVAVRAANGTLHVLSANSGTELWFDEQEVPTLSLRGASTPLIVSGVVITGTDAGKLISFSVVDGAVIWERLLGLPRGSTELERLIDIDGNIGINETNLFAVGFNTRLAKIDARNGSVIWGKTVSSSTGVGVGLTNVFVSTSDDHLVAYNQESGSQTWKTEDYQYRELTTPTPTGQALVVGDLEGFVHFISPTDGNTLARTKISKAAIKQAPIYANDMVYVIADDGQLLAFKITG